MICVAYFILRKWVIGNNDDSMTKKYGHVTQHKYDIDTPTWQF